MGMPEKRNPGWRAGASNNSQTIGHGLSVHGAEIVRRLQYRLSANALAIDALGPDLDFAMRCAHLMSLGMPLPGDAPQRLNRLSLRLIDARHVLEAELPPEVGHLDESQRAKVAARIANMSHGGDRKSDQGANSHVEPVTRARAAEPLNVGTRTVAAAGKEVRP